MKLIKSMLALAAAVFIGTSAQAEDITLKIGESVTRTCTYSGDRWWKVYDGDAAIASAAFETPATQYAGTDYEGLVSVKQGNNFAVTFTGVRAGTTTWQTTTYTDAGQMAGGDAPGYETARVGYPSGTTYGGTSGNQWGNSKGTYTITVVDPDMPDDVEAVALKVGGTKAIALTGGDATTEWTTLVKGNENDSVELDQTEATGAAFNATISALATGAATVIVKKDGVPFKAYEVTVSIDTDTKYHLAKGDTVRLGYRSGSSNGNSWTATITGSGASATPTSGSNRNFATTVTAEGEGAAHVKVTLTRNGSATTQDDRDIEIDAKRVVYVGKSAQYGLYSPLSANWAVPAVAAGAIASAKYITSGQNSAIVEIAGKSVGETTVTAGNANNNNQGAAYTLAVEVRDIPQPAEGKYPVLTMSQTLPPSFALSVLNGELNAIAMVDSNGNPVEGEWAWVNPSATPAIGTFEYEAKFTPEGDYYDVVTAKIPVKAQLVKNEHEGDPLTLTVGGTATIEDPYWTEDWTASSDDETIATVPASGEMGTYPVVTAVAPGKTKVVVEDSVDRWTWEVTVRAADQKDTLELMLNGTGTSRCTSAVAAAWTAESSDEGVVTVTAEGEESTVFTPVFTAVAAGTATVTVKNEFASYTITVTVLPFEAGKVNLAVGDSVVMADNSGKSGQQTLRETDKRFFEVTLEGEGVTTDKTGIQYPSNHFVKTTITATAADKEATVTVRRSSTVKNGELQPDVIVNNTYQIATVEARTVNVGEKVKAYCFSNQGNAWTATSGDESIATVTASGKASSVFLPEIVALKAGEVTITVSNMADQNGKAEFPKGATYTLKVKVVVPYIDIPVPTAEEELYYDGTEQTGVAEGKGYTIKGNTAKDAGNYTATATLEDGYRWEDGSFEPATIPWTIGKATLTAIADNKEVEFGGEKPEFTVTYKGWVKGEEDPEVKPELDAEYEAGYAPGEYRITFTTEPVFKNYEVDTMDGMLMVTPGSDITIHIMVDEGNIEAVNYNGGNYANKELVLPAGTKQVELTLEAGASLNVPVYKWVKDGQTRVTTRVATYDISGIKSGDTLEFFAEEADDSDATDEQIKAALLDWVDGEEGAAEKINKIVGSGAKQVSAKDLATYIDEHTVLPSGIVESEYVAASVKLNTDKLIDSEDWEFKFTEAASETSDGFIFDLELFDGEDSVDFENDNIAVYIQATEDLTTVFTAIDEGRVSITDKNKVLIEPKKGGTTEFFKIALPPDSSVSPN